MTKWWRKYWKEKGHKRKEVCNNLLGIDSFYILQNKRCLAMNHKDYFAFNNQDENCEQKIKVVTDGDNFYFVLTEHGRNVEGRLFEDHFNVSFIEFFLNSSVGIPTITKRASYPIHIERLQLNGGTFFRCPGKDCNRRIRKLYYSRGYFLCRKCLNLGYESQRISPFSRARRARIISSL